MLRLVHELRLFFIALQFMTRLPTPRWVGFEPEWLHASARHFPAVGLLVGSWGALVLVLGQAVFTPAVAAWLSIAATVWCTGAFHEDGWADTCDGLGSGAARTRALEIMKDSRIGAFGAVGLVLMLGLKAAVLAALPLPAAWAAVLAAHTLSRSAAVALIRFLPYAGEPGQAKARPLAASVDRVAWWSALGWSLLLGLALLAWRPASWGVLLACLAGAGGLAAVCGRRFQQRLGGVTGDTLGAAQQVVEVGVLLIWLAFVRQSWA